MPPTLSSSTWRAGISLVELSGDAIAGTKEPTGQGALGDPERTRRLGVGKTDHVDRDEGIAEVLRQRRDRRVDLADLHGDGRIITCALPDRGLLDELRRRRTATLRSALADQRVP